MPREQAFTEYVISKNYRTLTLKAGFSDFATSSAVTASVKIFGDGRLLAEQPVKYGQATPIPVDVKDVLRLKIQWNIAGLAADTCDPKDVLAFADTLLVP